MYALKNAKVFDGNSFLHDNVVVISKGIIVDILPSDSFNLKYHHVPTHDLQDSILVPSFIDLQLNGCGGVLFNDDISVNTLEIMYKTCLKYATTSFLPTLITTTDEEIKKAVQVVIDYQKKDAVAVLGIHIEGPYISKIKKGIHNPIYMKEIPDDMVEFLCQAAQKTTIKITMASEVNPPEKIHTLTKAGVIVSLGHSNATYEEAKEGFTSGATLATHLFNAMSPFEGRSPGLVGAVLNTPEVYCGVIVDGHHVHYASLEIVKKIKQDKIYIVTDAVTPLGTNITTFKLADQEITVKDGMCMNANGTLAGANIDMISSINNVIKHTNISLAEALRMATLYPATAIKKHNNLGLIAKDFIANMAIFDSSLTLQNVIVKGEFTSESSKKSE